MTQRPKGQPQEDPRWEDEAVKKTRRLRRARREGDKSLYTLARVGALAWLFILPVLAAAWFAHFALRELHQRWLALPIFALGVLLGAAFVRRKIVSLLDERDDDDDDA